MSQKPSKVLQQSGVVPYRVSHGKVEVLLITNRRQQHWGIPKGSIKTAMSPPDSAAEEAWEEAGIIGQVDRNELGTYNYRKQGNTYQVKVFLLPVDLVLSDWPEAPSRQRQWVDVATAVKRVQPIGLKRLLKTHFNSVRLVSILGDMGGHDSKSLFPPS